MRSKNTMALAPYVWENLYWSFLLYLVYRKVLFRPAAMLDFAASTLLLFGTALCGCVLGILLTHKRSRNHLSIVCNVILTFGVYFLVSFWGISKQLVIVSAVTAAVLVVCYCGLVAIMYQIDIRRKRIRISARKCVHVCMLNCRTILACTLAVIMGIMAIKPMEGTVASESNEDDRIVVATLGDYEGETIAENMDTVLLLQEATWDKLSIAERLDVMQTVADIEANHLGISKLPVYSRPLDENTLGYYNSRTKSITLNRAYLAAGDAHTMLITICHECYHAYQHKLVEVYNSLDPSSRNLLLFYEASQYQKEFENYIDSTEDYLAYRLQRCETDSNAYAAEAASEYYRKIDQYNKENVAGKENDNAY